MHRPMLVVVLGLIAGCAAPASPRTAPAPVPVLPTVESSPATTEVITMPAIAPSSSPAIPAFAAPWHRVNKPGQATASSGYAVLAVDGDPTTEWNPRALPIAGTPQWLALPLAGPATGTLAVSWTSHALHYQDFNQGCPRSYKIEVSSDSTDGKDGHWQTAAQIVDNAVRSRVTTFEAPGATWVRLSFSDVWDTYQFEPFLREVQIYEADGPGAPDCTLIMGDSTTAVGFDPAQPAYFQQAVQDGHPGYAGLAISGGTGGDQSGDALKRLQVGLPTLPAGSVVGLLYGANDASANVPPETYRANLQAAIDFVRQSGDLPVLAVVSWTENGQMAQYADVCRQLTASNQLPPGPDFYTYFQAHPDQLQVDRVHPDPDGVKAMQQLWATALAFRYPH